MYKIVRLFENYKKEIVLFSDNIWKLE